MKDATGSTGRRLDRARARLVGTLLLAGLLLAAPVGAEPLPVALRAPSAETAASFATLLEQYGDGRIRVVARATGETVTLALGERAFLDALATPGHGPVLGVGIARSVATSRVRDGCQCSAIWRGAPLATQLAVLGELMPDARRIGVLIGPNSAWRTPLMAPPGRLLDTLTVETPRKLGPLLRRHLPDWDALLLPEDPVLFGAGAAKLVLLTSYRQRVPVFGPGADYVLAGSVASAWLDSADLARASLDWLAHRRGEGAWPAPGFAGHYSLSVNEYVARAYDLSLGERGRLERRLGTSP